MKNLFLNILTLGFYRFWARTKVRRFIWNKMEVMGSPLEYTGTGKELFLGFLMIVFVVFLPYGILSGLLDSTGLLEGTTTGLIFNIATYGTILFLFGVAAYRAQRYRLTRTRWRSVRTGLTGSSWKYGAWYLLFYVAKIFFGLITPYQNMFLWRMKIQNTHVGNNFFVFDKDGNSREALKSLYKAYAVPGLAFLFLFFGPIIFLISLVDMEVLNAVITQEALNKHFSAVFSGSERLLLFKIIFVAVAIAILVFATAWYKLRETKILVGLTTFEDLTLSFNAGLFSWFKLFLGNLLIMVLTLGLGRPFTQVRSASFAATHTHIDGQLDLATIIQSGDDELTSGEGLADAFDMGAV